MAATAPQYRGVTTLHQPGPPNRMQSMRMQEADAPPSPPSARPRAFPLAGASKPRPSPTRSASEIASRPGVNASLLSSTNPELADMQPAPLFSSPLLSAQRSIDGAMKDTRIPIGAGTIGAGVQDGATTNAFASGGLGSSTTDVDLEIRRSVCQSPSWEAYTQRKQDKKGAKKEKEQALKEAKSKPRRLSKPPPPSPSLAFRSRRTQSEQNVSKTSSSRQQSRDRSENVFDLEEPPTIGSSSRRSRSRSGSFSSLIKSTFEIRRPSIDSSLDNGFIGGIKLEQQLIAVEDEQRQEEARQAKEDELGVHPALRSDKTSRRPGPVATGPPASTRSRYPPSAWQTSPSAASLISSTAAQPPEPSTINKWRNRVGLRAKPNGLQIDTRNGEQATVSTRHLTSVPGARTSSTSLTTPARHSLDNPRRQLHGFGSAIELPAFENWPGPYTNSPPPPEPPLKSSKRKSVGSFDSPISLKSSFGRLESAERNPNAYANVVALDPPRRASTDMPAISPLFSNGQRRSFKEAARAALGKTPARSGPSEQSDSQTNAASANGASSRQPELLRRAQTSSSEDSLSDEYHSTGSLTTTATTPDVSRPQSEKGFFSLPPKFNTGSTKRKPVAKRSESSPGPSPYSRALTEDELDPIQAAAQKVRAAFPESSNRSLGMGRRTQSESSTQRETPRLRHPTLKPADRSKTKVPLNIDTFDDSDGPQDLRELILTKDQSSVAAPWPASYLEAARKAAPSAPVPRNKPTGFPSPSLSTLSSGLAPPSPRSQVFTLGPSDNSGNQSPVRTPASSLAGSTGANGSSSEPLAKMFVECCGCRYYHDMPSKLYEAMSNPEGALSGQSEFAHSPGLQMTVRCPWCQHDMSTKCCAGLAAMVYVKERLH